MHYSVRKLKPRSHVFYDFITRSIIFMLKQVYVETKMRSYSVKMLRNDFYAFTNKK